MPGPGLQVAAAQYGPGTARCDPHQCVVAGTRTRVTLQVDLQAAAVRSRLCADHRVRAERVREDGGWGRVEVEVTRAAARCAGAREAGISRAPIGSSCVH